YYRVHGQNMSCRYRGARDLRQLKLTFDLFFAELGSRTPGAEELCVLASQGLGGRVFDEAYHALSRDEDRFFPEYVQLARELDPRPGFGGKWLRLRWQHRLGPRVGRSLQACRRWLSKRTRGLPSTPADRPRTGV